jgi:uncharacterized membrane protein
MKTVILIVFLLTFPAFLLYLCKVLSFFNKLGVILLAYAFGLIIGNLGILPDNAPVVIDKIITIVIPLALPLLLFSSNIHRWYKMAGRTSISMLLALISLLAIVVSGFYIFGHRIENAWQVAGMAVGVYSGGIPNMAAISVALDVKNEVYMMAYTSDMIAGSVYILFYVSIAQKVYQIFLPKFKMNNSNEISDLNQDFDSYDGIFRMKVLKGLAIALGISMLILAISLAFSLLFPNKYEMATVILSITALGIVSSLIPKVRKLEKTFQLGMYLIIIFSLSVACLGDMSKIEMSSLHIFYYISYVIFGTAFLHLLLSAIFRIDSDTTIISQVAFIMSPPFVPVAAAALKNKDIIISGILVGIIGYAIGNFLGISLAYMLK